MWLHNKHTMCFHMGMKNNIPHYRKQAGLTQKALCERMGMKVSRLANYETGIRDPGLPECRAILRALLEAGASCTLDDLFPPDVTAKAA